jgi:PAS domain S-box-containing protein
MSIKTEMAEGKDKLLGDVLDVIRFTEGISAKLHRLLDEAKIYQVVKEEFAKSDRYTMGILLLADDGASLKVAETSMTPSKLKVLERASGQQVKEFVLKLSKSSICRQVVREGKTVHTSIGDVIREILPRPLAYLISKTMGYDKQFSILTPIYKHGKATGVLAMYSAGLGEYFAPPVENLALHISTALELADEHTQRKRAVQALEKYHGHLGELVEERTAELEAVNVKLREEITERKRAEEELQAEKNKLQSLVDAMEDGLTIQDKDYNIIYQNEPLRKNYGEHLGDKCYRAYEGREKVCEGCPVEMAFKDGESHTTERRVVLPSGKVAFGEVTANLIRDAEGKIISCLEVVRDITQRKRADEALRESREKFQKMFESVTDGISVVDLSGVIIETNQRAVEMHGFASRDELLRRNASELIAPRDRERIAANMRRAVKEGIVRGAEYTLLKADGTEFPGELSTSVLRDASGKVVAHITIARDITERKRMEGALRESEERFRSIVENSQAGIIILDDAFRFVYVNDELCRISGYSRDELIGQDFREFLDEESQQLVAERYIQRQRGKEIPPRYEFSIVKKDGQKRRVEISSAVIKDSAGEVRTVAQLLDITERKRAAEALQAEKNKLQSLVDAMEDGLTIQDKDYNIIYQNEPTRISSGGDHVGEKCYRVYEGREKVCEGCPVEKAFKDSKSHTAERKTVAPSGEDIFWETTANPIRDASGEIVACLEIGRDITERKRAEQALRESQKFSSNLLESSPNPISVVDVDTSIRYVNPAFEKLTGFTLAEIAGRKAPYPWWPEGKRERILAAFKDAIEHGGRRTERNFQRKNGKRFWVALNSAPIMEGGKAVYLIINWLDITERKQAEEQLQESEDYLKTLFNASTGGILVIEPETHKIVDANPAIIKMIGMDREEVIGRVCHQFICPEEKGQCPITDLKQRVDTKECVFLNASGEEVPALKSVVLITRHGHQYLLELIFDITERKRAEEKEKQLQQELYLTQRLASVGELAAGVAHEINNPLTGVLGFSQRLMRKSTDEKVSHDLEVIHSEAQRAAEVVQSLLTFARRRQPKKEYANINDIVNKTLELRAYALQTGNIEVVTTLAPRLPQIMVDFSQMQEVFLNIILNAEQAMSEARGKGKLTIKTRRIKDYVRISFADNGPGISPENLDKVFDPFFTTREEKGGTGLGLSACHGIVTEHGGRIYATSKPRKGATFFVELPLPPVEATIGRRG